MSSVNLLPVVQARQERHQYSVYCVSKWSKLSPRRRWEAKEILRHIPSQLNLKFIGFSPQPNQQSGSQRDFPSQLGALNLKFIQISPQPNQQSGSQRQDFRISCG